MPYIPNRICRGICMVCRGDIPHKSLCRLVLVNSMALLVSWFFRMVGGETHRASIHAAEFGMSTWFLCTIFLIYAEVGCKETEKSKAGQRNG